VSKQDIQKQLTDAYAALSDLKDREARGARVSRKKREAFENQMIRSQRVLQTHIRYLKQLLQEAS
jgi:hypothetical protein